MSHLQRRFAMQRLLAGVVLVAIACPTPLAAQTISVQLDQLQKKATILVGDDLFTQYDYGSYAKPILYPVMAPGQVSITRNFPMRKDVEGEANDHPHHKSIWFAHGDVNGIDFWSERGTIRCTAIEPVSEPIPGLKAQHEWTSDGKTVCSDQTTILFETGEDWRSITYRVTLFASHGELRLGDTKEGTFAMRTHPALRIVDQQQKPQAQAVNSAGETGKQIWGKKAKWVQYSGKIDGQDYAITMMDHPSNLRHPTTWHAREYGLVAANPFGLHDFLREPPGAGEFVIPDGEQLLLQYRIVIWRGPLQPNASEEAFSAFARQ